MRSEKARLGVRVVVRACAYSCVQSCAPVGDGSAGSECAFSHAVCFGTALARERARMLARWELWVGWLAVDPT
jgi:hypothetical protein